MKIKKIGHCCLRVEHKDVVILTDPGSFSEAQNQEINIDILLITHEHQDHFHIDSIKKVITNNPSIKIFANKSVGKLLDVEKIACTILTDKQKISFKNLEIECFEQTHAPIYPEIEPVLNTGYLIDNILFYPGDAYINLNKEITVLALPVCGPWVLLSEAIDYAISLKPKKVFPVHDEMLKITGPFYSHPKKFLSEKGIEFLEIKNLDAKEF